MDETIDTIKATLALIPAMKRQFGVRANQRDCRPLLFTGVAESVVIERLEEHVSEYFGSPYKPAGSGAFFMNLFDSFVRSVGGVNRDQTLFRKNVTKDLTLFCAFWPWGSNPVKTSVRLGLICRTDDERKRVEGLLAGSFE